MDEGVGIVVAEEGLAIQFDDDGLAGEAEGVEEGGDADGGLERVGLAVDLDGGHGGRVIGSPLLVIRGKD